ncbi:hypothetical protein Hanom_Chr09g00763451 [Helianthus anomalus]
MCYLFEFVESVCWVLGLCLFIPWLVLCGARKLLLFGTFCLLLFGRGMIFLCSKVGCNKLGKVDFVSRSLRLCCLDVPGVRVFCCCPGYTFCLGQLFCSGSNVAAEFIFRVCLSAPASYFVRVTGFNQHLSYIILGLYLSIGPNFLYVCCMWALVGGIQPIMSRIILIILKVGRPSWMSYIKAQVASPISNGWGVLFQLCKAQFGPHITDWAGSNVLFGYYIGLLHWALFWLDPIRLGLFEEAADKFLKAHQWGFDLWSQYREKGLGPNWMFLFCGPSCGDSILDLAPYSYPKKAHLLWVWFYKEYCLVFMFGPGSMFWLGKDIIPTRMSNTSRCCMFFVFATTSKACFGDSSISWRGYAPLNM